MSAVLLAYLLKLTLSQAMVYLFYQLVLQNLTFYNWNRWYLLAFMGLSFLIPLIDVSTLWHGVRKAPIPAVIQYFPPVAGAMPYGEMPQAAANPALNNGDWLLMGLLSGIFILFIRLGVQVISFLQLRRASRLISEQPIKIYQVDAAILPFTFGRSVFLNQPLHQEKDLPEIIRHELVHVQQGHTADIVWMELVCILNWYNPFVWLLRGQLRQKLEFIADRQVLQTGTDKKQYQYLLLQVTGTPAFGLANQFNFSTLKKTYGYDE